MTSSSRAVTGIRAEDVYRSGQSHTSEERSAETPAQPPSLAERVFSALASAKIWTSLVAMHMPLAARDRYFRQLDLLHDCDEWFGDDQPLQLDSYKSFVRFMLLVGGQSTPALALSSKGNLLAVWEREHGRLTIEFKADAAVEWVVSHQIDGVVERAAGTTSIKRVLSNIGPYNPGAWFQLDQA